MDFLKGDFSVHKQFRWLCRGNLFNPAKP